MTDVSLIEQLDSAIETIVARSASRATLGAAVEPLARVASELIDLPRPDFKQALRADLERRASMTARAAQPIRKGFHTVTPYVIVEQAAELIDFVKRAFDAEELFRGTGSAGGIHAEVKIGDSMLMMGGGSGLKGFWSPTGLHLYVQDTDAVYHRAIEAGAVSLHEPVDQPYGDREASVKDTGGNRWYIATHNGPDYKPEGLRSVTVFLHPKGADRLIDFLTRAFGAEEQSRYQSPDGVIHHATIRIGDSMVEMGEAHGPWQPMPTTFFLYVEDVDALYERAVAAGGVSLSEPRDQYYGDRVAGVRDPFENTWYIATHIRDGNL